MSILLEALKKSEEQRQLGSTPDIHGSVDHKPGGKSAREQQWIPLSLILIAVLAMAWFGWQQYRPADAETVEVVAEPARESAGDTVAEQVPAKAQPPSGQRTPVETLNADTSQSAAESGVRRPGDKLLRSVSSFTAAKDESSGGEAAVDSADQSEPPIEVEDPTALRRGSEMAGSERQASRPDPLQPHISEPVSFWELPQSVRDSLPEIRITVLVYADEPAARFALINGQRMVESDDLTSGVVLDEIRRDGAVFVYRKYRFLVKG